ncbi:MAG: nicotinamide-nucleotide amidohydrolase family protein [Rhodobacteraceae bacterium]|nr:nicotinamide-nucleotide amidohydrolase family protein [Paracoccaceae bacterium]
MDYDLDALAGETLAACRARGDRLATAESCTGGLIATALTEIAGASDVVICGYVTYSNAAKSRMLGVDGATLKTRGAVSETVARQMADGALARSGAEIAVSVTGIAGPGRSWKKPEGRVCFGLARAGHPTTTMLVAFGAAGRSNVRLETAKTALVALRDGVLPSSR